MKKLIEKLEGPIAIFGAGGFVGINLLAAILKVRTDVVGFSQDPQNSWRMKKALIPAKNKAVGDLLNVAQTSRIIKKLKPRTIFNLSAYGAYPTQNDIDKIYQTNFNSTYNLIEQLKKYTFNVYVHAGSQSEYGLNANKPNEQAQLVPNSHYAVSKIATRYLLNYYGRLQQLPVVHMRLYSIYGKYEEPSRLIPTLLSHIQQKKLPPFVNPSISRDFVYIDDAIEAILTTAIKLKKKQYGEVFNVATGKKTTIRELAHLSKKLFNLPIKPDFSTMSARAWDVKDWVGNPKKIHKNFGWKARTTLKNGLKKTFNLMK